MEIKQNEATPNRPDGERIIDAPWVFTDLEKIIDQLKSENAWDKNERNGITIFKTDKLSTVVTILKKDAEIKENSVDGLFVIHLLKGKVTVTTGGNPFDLVEGQIMHLHKNIGHSIKAQEETTLLINTYLT